MSKSDPTNPHQKQRQITITVPEIYAQVLDYVVEMGFVNNRGQAVSEAIQSVYTGIGQGIDADWRDRVQTPDIDLPENWQTDANKNEGHDERN